MMVVKLDSVATRQAAKNRRHLECVEHNAFQPVGWLYTSVFEGLAVDGLVIMGPNGYVLTVRGQAALNFLRNLGEL